MFLFCLYNSNNYRNSKKKIMKRIVRLFLLKFNLFYQSSFDTSFSLKLKLRFGKKKAFGIHRLKTLAPVHRSNNISKCSYSSSYFLPYRLDCLIQSWCQGKMSYFTDFVLPRKFSNDSERRAQVSISFSLQLTIAGFILFI